MQAAAELIGQGQPISMMDFINPTTRKGIFSGLDHEERESLKLACVRIAIDEADPEMAEAIRMHVYLHRDARWTGQRSRTKR